MIVDVNAHLPWLPRETAERILDHIDEQNMDSFTSYLCQLACHQEIMPDRITSIEDFWSELDESGICKAVIASAVSTYGQCEEDLRKGRSEIEEAVGTYPDRLIPSCPINPHCCEESLRQIEKASANTLAGPLFPYVQGYSLEDVSTRELVERATMKGLPVWLYACREEVIDQVIALAKAFPQGKFLMSCAAWVDRIEEIVEAGNMWVDTSGYWIYTSAFCSEAIQELGDQRLLFGSGFPVWNARLAIQRIREIDIPSEATENILYRNAVRLISCE